MTSDCEYKTDAINHIPEVEERSLRVRAWSDDYLEISRLLKRKHIHNSGPPAWLV
jgi:hypothetical protein